jgi:hypothetical protein
MPNERMTRQLVECYWPGMSEQKLLSLARRARSAASDVRLEGSEVDFVTSILVRADETVFCLFDGGESDVRTASQRAGLLSSACSMTLQIDDSGPGEGEAVKVVLIPTAPAIASTLVACSAAAATDHGFAATIWAGRCTIATASGRGIARLQHLSTSDNATITRRYPASYIDFQPKKPYKPKGDPDEGLHIQRHGARVPRTRGPGRPGQHPV